MSVILASWARRTPTPSRRRRSITRRRYRFTAIRSPHSYYSYDADGKRVRIHPHGFDPTSFIYQGPDMLRLQTERDAEGETVAHYTIGAAGGLEAQRRDEASSFYHFDWLGSTFALTDAAQDVTDTYRYNAWGEVLSSTGSTTNRHTWVGRERYIMTKNSDLALLGLRYYMPSIGRFTTVDPRSLATAVAEAIQPLFGALPAGRAGAAELVLVGSGPSATMQAFRVLSALFLRGETACNLRPDLLGPAIAGVANAYVYAANSPATLVDPEGAQFKGSPRTCEKAWRDFQRVLRQLLQHFEDNLNPPPPRKGQKRPPPKNHWRDKMQKIRRLQKDADVIRNHCEEALQREIERQIGEINEELRKQAEELEKALDEGDLLAIIIAVLGVIYLVVRIAQYLQAAAAVGAACGCCVLVAAPGPP